ncbi:MAG: Uma2 family endonuclease, partial [Thermomicrobiales bacterium]
SEILRKVAIYLRGGSKLVWLVRPRQRTVTVFSPDRPELVLASTDILDGADMLPGFSLPLAKLFSWTIADDPQIG